MMTTLEACGKVGPKDMTRSGKPSCVALSRLVGRRVSAAERDRAWSQYRNRRASAEARKVPRPRPRGSLMQGITEANGYRPAFVRFMEKHLVEPRQNAFDRVYEWARGMETNRRGMPGCGCQQRLLHSLDMPGAWKSSLKDLYRRKGRVLDAALLDAESYGGDPSPARVSAERNPPPSQQSRLPPPSRRGPKPDVSDLRRRVLAARVKVSRRDLETAIARSGLQYLRREWLQPATYYALPLDLWSELLEWSDVDGAEYVLGERDCKTFSMALAAQMKLRFRVTCLWVFDSESGHAYNGIVVCGDFDGDGAEDIQVLAVEPQTDRIPQLGSGSHKAGDGKLVIL